MTKNIADAFQSKRGVISALLAQRGFTGPQKIIDGNKGFIFTVLGGPDNYIPLPDSKRFWILDTMMKYFCAEATTQGHLNATTDIVREHRIEPKDIKHIRIRTNKRTALHTGDPAKKFPNNKETADHSSYFLTAVAVLDGNVTPASYTPSKYSDPQIHALINKIEIEYGPEFDTVILGAEVIIETMQGKIVKKRIDHPKGHPENRMTNDEIRNKLIKCASSLMTTEKIDRIIETFLHLDRVQNIRDIMPLLAVEQ